MRGCTDTGDERLQSQKPKKKRFSCQTRPSPLIEAVASELQRFRIQTRPPPSRRALILRPPSCASLHRRSSRGRRRGASRWLTVERGRTGLICMPYLRAPECTRLACNGGKSLQRASESRGQPFGKRDPEWPWTTRHDLLGFFFLVNAELLLRGCLLGWVGWTMELSALGYSRLQFFGSGKHGAGGG